MSKKPWSFCSKNEQMPWKNYSFGDLNYKYLYVFLESTHILCEPESMHMSQCGQGRIPKLDYAWTES